MINRVSARLNTLHYLQMGRGWSAFLVQWNLVINNEVLGTMKITLLYQVSHYIRVKTQRNIKSWDQQNYLVIRGFCYILPLYNEVPLYQQITLCECRGGMGVYAFCTTRIQLIHVGNSAQQALSPNVLHYMWCLVWISNGMYAGHELRFSI